MAKSKTEEETIPGPGTYNYDPSAFKQGQKFGFGTGDRMRSRSRSKGFETPAPGAYDIPNTVGLTTAKTISGKPQQTVKSIKDMPGPGTYDPTPLLTEKKWQIGKGKRPDPMKPNNLPGPGQYSTPNLDTSLKYAFSKSKRPPLTSENKFPGPGECFITEIEKKSKKSKLYVPKKMLKESVTNLPGPGHYQVKDANRSKSPSYKIGTGKRINLSDSFYTVGPASYETRRTMRGGYTIGRTRRFKKEQSNQLEDPGPGYYDLPPTVPDVPKYLLNKKQMLSISMYN